MANILRKRQALSAAKTRGGIALVAALSSARCASTEAFSERDACLVSGSDSAAFLGLSPGEASAIVALRGPGGSICSGVLVSSRSVLTAAHCASYSHDGSVEIILGNSLACPNATVSGKFVASDIAADIALVDVPGLSGAGLAEPIMWNEEPPDESWSGRLVQLAGFGTDTSSPPGPRRFLVGVLAKITNESLLVDGRGASGACAGDSGGPMLVRARSGAPVIAGILSKGSPSCVGEDGYARVDRVSHWIREHVPPPEWKRSCGMIDETGRCFGGNALRCASASLVVETCDASAFCSWTSQGRYGCVKAAMSECGHVDQVGQCVGEQAHWCERGKLFTQACLNAAEPCHASRSTGRATCAE